MTLSGQNCTPSHNYFVKLAVIDNDISVNKGIEETLQYVIEISTTIIRWICLNIYTEAIAILLVCSGSHSVKLHAGSIGTTFGTNEVPTSQLSTAWVPPIRVH